MGILKDKTYAFSDSRVGVPPIRPPDETNGLPHPLRGW